MYRRNPGRYAEKETRLFARKEKKVERKPGGGRGDVVFKVFVVLVKFYWVRLCV